MRSRRIKMMKALIRADEEAERGISTIVLVPSQVLWHYVVDQCVAMLYGDMGATHPREGVYIRYATSPATLEHASVDGVIVVDGEFTDEHAKAKAYERTEGSRYRYVIYI